MTTNPAERKTPPRAATQVTDDVFFYQSAKSFDFHVWTTGYDGQRVHKSFRLPAGPLLETWTMQKALRERGKT